MIIVASGPSITDRQIELINNAPLPVMAINRSWCVLEPRPTDHLYIGDYFNTSGGDRSVMADGFPGQVWTQRLLPTPDPTRLPNGVMVVTSTTGSGLNTARWTVNHGGNSGHQAINLAYHLGAKEIILVGFDFAYGPDGQSHSHGDHPPGWGNFNNPEARRTPMNRLAIGLRNKGITVWNCSIYSTLDCWPHKRLDHALRDYGDWSVNQRVDRASQHRPPDTGQRGHRRMA